MPRIDRSTSRAAACLLLALVMGACSDNSSRGGTDDGTPTEPLVDSGDAQPSDAGALCDTDCIADRLLAMYLAMEPACRCNAMSGNGTLTAERIADCSIVAAQEASEFLSPRECIAQFASDPETAAELESWIACREERLRSRGPCIMELQAGGSCDQCPSFWEADRVDPCQSPQDEDVVVTCYDQMSGRPWE
jgi:hypothetical protein